MKYFKLLVLCFFGFSCFILKDKTNSMQPSMISDTLKEQCIQVLRTILHTQSKWVKVHAAEYLLWSGYPDGVRETFINEEQHFGTESPYRIGIWRVLAQCNEKEKKVWTDKILKVFQNTNGIDRVHAAETLGKLRISPLQGAPEATKQALIGSDKLLSLYTKWSVSFSSRDSLIVAQKDFFKLLISKEVESSTKRIAAYVLRQFRYLTIADWNLLSKKALLESYGSETNLNLVSTAFVTTPMDSVRSNSFKEIRKKLLKYYDSPNESDLIEMVIALSQKGTKEDLPILIFMLNDKNSINNEPDVKASVAYAILIIGKFGSQ